MTPNRWLAAVLTISRKSAVSAFLLLMAVSSPSTAAPHLRPLGPHRGNLREVRVLASDPSRPGRAFAVLANGGIVRSDDGGRTWRLMSDGLNGPAVGSIIVHPRNGQLVYAVGAHLLRSLDGGRTWTPLPLEGVYIVVPDPRDPAVVWAGTARGLFRSGDTGQTWKRIQANLPRPYGIGLLAVDHVDPQRLYIRLLGSFDRDLWTSGNGGRSWVRRRTEPSRGAWLYTDLHVAQTIYLGGSSRILRSRDAGETWEHFLDIPDHPNSGLMAGDPRNASTFFAPLFNDGMDTLYRTTDAGRHWRPLTRGLPSRLRMRALTVGGDGTVLLAGDDISEFMVLRSVDSGDTWDLVARGATSVSIDAIAVTGSGGLFVGIRVDGVERSLDGGATWTKSLPLFPFPTCITRDPHAPETLYVCTAYPYGTAIGFLWKTVDGGASWVPLPYPFADNEVVDAQDLAVDPVDFQTLYLVAGGGLFRSRDGGQTWEGIGGPDNTYESVTVHAGAPGIVLAQGLLGVYRSTDHGDTWTQVLAREGDSYVRYVDFSPADPNVVYAVSGITLFRSDDGGATFSSIGELLQVGPIALDPLDPDTIVFSSPQGALMRLTLGQGPEVMQGGATHNYVQTLAFDPNDPLRLFVGTGDLGLMEYRFEPPPTP